MFPINAHHSAHVSQTLIWIVAMAGLYKYFQRQSLPTSSETGLGEVATAEANASVQKVLEEQRGEAEKGRKRKYTHFTPEQRAKIAKYAAESGNTAAVKHFKKEFATLGESTVRLFKKQYELELKRSGHAQEITSLPKKKQGRPVTLGELDGKVQQYLRSLRRAGAPVNARIVIAAAEGIIKATDRTMLSENGGHVQLTKAWSYSILKRMGFVQRKATTKTKMSLSKAEFELAKKRYLKKIKRAVTDAKIPPQLVVNWDQTGVNIVPASQWTQEEQGSSRVEVAGIGDKRQITITVAGTLSGSLLPFQVLYEGKTERCHPSTTFPEGFDIWHTPNHWANSLTSIRFVKNIVLPYISATRRDLGLEKEHMALVIFDAFKGHKGEEINALLMENNILSVIVPSNCTDLLQPLDLSVNKPLKDHLKRSFQSWYSDQVSKQLQDGRQPEDIKVDTKLSIMKPLGARWITSAYDYLRSQSDIIHGGFSAAGIVEVLGVDGDDTDDSDEDPFQDLDN